MKPSALKCRSLLAGDMTCYICFSVGDHFYKENFSFALEDQMISAMPDIKSIPITDDDEFIVFACDGIW